MMAWAQSSRSGSSNIGECGENCSEMSAGNAMPMKRPGIQMNNWSVRMYRHQPFQRRTFSSLTSNVLPMWLSVILRPPQQSGPVLFLRDLRMPIYEYVCGACGNALEALQKISDAPLTDCPECGAASLKKKVSAPAFRLAGSGWYETDFKTGAKKNLVNDSSTGSDSGSSSTSATSSSSATSTTKSSAD